MYETISELPFSVQKAMPPDLQKVWMETYNNSKCGRKAWQAVEKDIRSFGGIAGANVKDSQGEIVEVKSLIDDAENFFSRGSPLYLNHKALEIGTAYDYFQTEINGVPVIKVKCVIYQGDSLFDRTWDNVKNGIFTGFSVGFVTKEQKTICDKDGCNTHILKSTWLDLSVTPNPANPLAMVEEINYNVKSEGDLMTDEELNMKSKGEETKPEDEQKEEVEQTEEKTSDSETKESEGEPTETVDNVEAVEEEEEEEEETKEKSLISELKSELGDVKLELKSTNEKLDKLTELFNLRLETKSEVSAPAGVEETEEIKIKSTVPMPENSIEDTASQVTMNFFDGKLKSARELETYL